MATSGSKSFRSTKIDSRQTPSTTVDGCLAGRRPLCGGQKKNLPSLCQTKWRSWENLSNRFSSFLGVHQMILATFKSVNNASCRGMWEQQSKPSDLGWTGLHPDLGAARLGLDLLGPARILVLDCLFRQSRSTWRKKLLLAYQFGFRPGLSAADLITALTREWLTTLDKGGAVCLLAVDIAGTFDKVSHVGVLHKLSPYGGQPLQMAHQLPLEQNTSGRSGWCSLTTLPHCCWGTPGQYPWLHQSLFLIYVHDAADLPDSV